MASANAVWGIEIGQCALKAIKIRPAGDGQFEAVAFDVIEHPKILSQPDAEPDEIIKAAIEKFTSRNDWQRDQVVIGVPGQQTFSRYCKLPPVDAKKLPDIIRYEAIQQIPFDIEDVVWDYEVFSDADSPETEVGIFAMRKDLVRKQIEFYADHGMSPGTIQALPSAIFNFAHFEAAPESEEEALVIVDVGAQNTDLIIVEKNGAWTRNIPLGGNNFTEALIKGFKLSFAKAESLKRTAATSKYARQIFQAMRPVFAELVAEIQRSLGFYSSTHRDVELTRVVALGNAFQLPGLQKYLEQNLSIPGGVNKLEKFETLVPSTTLNAPKFTENILTFGGAYGLALQGLGEARIAANLLPTELARIAIWKKKTPFWIASAACLALASFCPMARTSMGTNGLDSDENARYRTQTAQIIRNLNQLVSEKNQAAKDLDGPQERINKFLDLTKERVILPRLVQLVDVSRPKPVSAFAKAQSREAYREAAATSGIERSRRKEVTLDRVSVTFSEGIEDYVPGEQGKSSKTSKKAGSMGGMGGMGGYPMGPGMMYGPMGPRGGFGPSSGGGGGGGGGKKGKDEGKDDPGFYIFVRGTLRYGRSKPDAMKVIEKKFIPNLVANGQKEGLGFYVLEDEDMMVQPTVIQLGQEMGVSDTDEITDDLKDPVTGEPIIQDWEFEFGFRVKLGDKPTEEELARAKAKEEEKKNSKKKKKKRRR